MYQSPSHLSEAVRAKVADALNERLADGLDLHSQIKVAHWNIKGPQFAALHPLFEASSRNTPGFCGPRSQLESAPEMEPEFEDQPPLSACTI